MDSKLKAAIITLVVGIPAFILSPILWPPSPDIKPTEAQLPFFIFLSFVEALFFGAGIAFISYTWPIVSKMAGKEKPKAMQSFLAISWLLVSWWPHDNFHIHNGMDAQGLLYIDYAFHMTLILAGAVLAYNFYRMTKAK
ncbi:MAG: hypothetical protein QW568_02745 [Candidatus Anstonellaceae archaeon]